MKIVNKGYKYAYSNVLNIWICLVQKHFINVKIIFLLTNKGSYVDDINNSLLFKVQ